MSDQELAQYEALTHGCGFARLDGWSVLEFSGDDRKSFLHSFCTADIKGLDDGSVTEAFILDGKGKALGHVHVIAIEDRLLLAGHSDQGVALFEHLDRYIIREKVVIVDRSGDFELMLIAGAKASDVNQVVLQADVSFGQALEVRQDAASVVLVHTEVAGPAFLYLVPKDSAEDFSARFKEHAVECSPAVLDAVRLEHATPWYGIEIDNTNLPQELERDDKAISFTKGCYLGQETVARIDSLGRVNKLLRIVEGDVSEGGEVARGDLVINGDKEVGRVLACARVPGRNISLASVMLKRASTKVGQVLQAGEVSVVVVSPKV